MQYETMTAPTSNAANTATVFVILEKNPDFGLSKRIGRI